MSGSLIILDLGQANQLKIKLGERLPPILFNTFRKACDAAGAHWSGMQRANLAPIASSPRVRQAFEAAGFRVEVSEALKSALVGMAGGLRTASGRLQARLSAIQSTLEASGKRLGQYQREGAAWVAPTDRALLGDQQGLGKTLQLLAAAPDDSPIMVVCPSVAKGVWDRETSMFRPEIGRSILSSSGSYRWPAVGELVALNYEIVPATLGELTAAREAAGPMDHEEAAEAFWASVPDGVALILDEAHYLKSNKTKRTERVRSMIKAVLKRGGRVWGATGTPLLNRQLELWNLLTTLQLHREAFGGFLQFADMFGAIKDRWGRYVWPDNQDGVGMSAEIANRLRRVMLRRLRKDVLPDLPEKIRQDVPVDIGGPARRMMDEAVAALAARGVTLEDAVAAAELGRFNDKDFTELSRAREQLARALIPSALEMATSYEESGEPVIVWSDHRAPLEAFRGRPGWALIEGGMSGAQKTEIENAFQAGKLLGLACSIKAAGTAITLTRAAHELFVDMSYVPGENDQAEDRCVRHGQTRGVLIRRLVPDHIVCKNLLDIVTAKMKLIGGTIDAAAVKTPMPKVDVEAIEKMGQANG